MSINITSPVTGAAQTGFTSPTYTVAADIAPDVYSKQVVVTALGGTQTGATAQSGADNPFTFTSSRQKVLKSAPSVNALSGLPNGQPGRNVLKLFLRKGMKPTTNSPRYPMFISNTYSVPAGAESVDASEIRAGVSLFIGILNQQAAGIGDTLVTGIL